MSLQPGEDHSIFVVANEEISDQEAESGKRYKVLLDTWGLGEYINTFEKGRQYMSKGESRKKAWSILVTIWYVRARIFQRHKKMHSEDLFKLLFFLFLLCLCIYLFLSIVQKQFKKKAHRVKFRRLVKDWLKVQEKKSKDKLLSEEKEEEEKKEEKENETGEMGETQEIEGTEEVISVPALIAATDVKKLEPKITHSFVGGPYFAIKEDNKNFLSGLLIRPNSIRKIKYTEKKKKKKKKKNEDEIMQSDFEDEESEQVTLEPKVDESECYHVKC
ncbi:hypothetical protein RFI_19811, partial [Reticulomyxa filosa]